MTISLASPSPLTLFFHNAQAILESAARSKELGTITLNLSFCEPFWKLLLGIPLNLMDLQLLDPTEFRFEMSQQQSDSCVLSPLPHMIDLTDLNAPQVADVIA